MQIPFLFVVILGIHSLQHQIWLLRFVDGDHVEGLASDHGDCFGERSLANLTLELGEVVRNDDIVEFLLHFAIDPVPQASHMDELTRSSTDAW